ncbi:hypothetical protein GGS26DRAFT_531478 [Hypomontagnella submonticulosa]|nr:hypothetical protein GGS26DRAFT_531478 [Hypomontagnella submonticulosa]
MLPLSAINLPKYQSKFLAIFMGAILGALSERIFGRFANRILKGGVLKGGRHYVSLAKVGIYVSFQTSTVKDSFEILR